MPHFRPPPAKTQTITRVEAELIASEVLGFFAGDPARLERFLALSGLRRENLRAAAQDPGFLGALLDHLAADEAALLAFSAGSGHEPPAVIRAWEILSPPAEWLDI
ncbi:MAG: DUF3572 domain-containing protein [Methylocapsa sp.]|nr:DUF3572 domain-containing protein [Methylocapsa sp.]